ncbi:cupin domain-containing protein [Longirhabdus pacifica]|uniref:cupin domain-containing protein n=1 Tax=Longirhabdus pacifica TaxID=2305227 RepID=UPI0010091AAE|nr:cupin domain-containing protein [Longirhabdus pacifica]
MKLYSLNKEHGKHITQYDSNFVMSKILQSSRNVHMGCMHLEQSGVIGWHQAKVSQLLIVIAGDGKVRGAEDKWHRVCSGDAVFWQEGEWHETIAENKGMTAIVIEGEQLEVQCLEK